MPRLSIRAGRPRKSGPREPNGRVSRALAPTVDNSSLISRLQRARALLSPDDAARLSLLITADPDKLAAEGLLALGRKGTPPTIVARREREALFKKADHAPNAKERADPIGRAWHEGLLDGYPADPVSMRNIGREYGFAYWHEYADVDATIGGYTEMLGRGSIASKSGSGHLRDAAGQRWRRLSAIVDPMGHAVRTALHRLCVDDMWFAEGPDWLDRIINTERAGKGRQVAGELERRGDRQTLALAVSALVAMSNGASLSPPRKSGEQPSLAELTQPEPDRLGLVPAVDADLIDEKGHMRPFSEIADILRSRAA